MLIRAIREWWRGRRRGPGADEAFRAFGERHGATQALDSFLTTPAVARHFAEHPEELPPGVEVRWVPRVEVRREGGRWRRGGQRPLRVMGLALDAGVSAMFGVVAQARRARFRRLVRESGLPEDEARRALRELRQHGLIKSSGGADELSTFYLTSKGLEAARAERGHDE